MKAAALRLGSQGLTTSYDDHLLIIGDAAGHIDPLTGEGIHTAIMVPCCPTPSPLPSSSPAAGSWPRCTCVLSATCVLPWMLCSVD